MSDHTNAIARLEPFVHGLGKAILREVAGELEAAQAAQPAKPGWLPIDTAPKDMASRLYRVNGFCVQGFVDAAGILCAQNDRQAWRKMHGKPTHWMPLPPRPAAPITKAAP